MIRKLKGRHAKLSQKILPLLCILVSATLLFCGCSFHVSKHAEDDLTQVREWLESDFSFTMTFQYTNLAINGISQQTHQSSAKDGSWYVNTQRKVWSHAADFEILENAEFYYQYENSNLICYSRTNGEAPLRTELTDLEQKDLYESKQYLVGCAALLPNYLQELSVNHADNETVFSFKLPVDSVLEDNTLLSVFISNVVSMSNNTYQSEYGAMILCSFVTDSQTLQPKSITYDFSEIKPYVLSEGAQSGEYAFDTDFITMTYTFDYNLIDTIEIPEHMIP